jgi:hypothetical protein
MEAPGGLLLYKFIYSFFGFFAGAFELIIYNDFIETVLE